MSRLPAIESALKEVYHVNSDAMARAVVKATGVEPSTDLFYRIEQVIWRHAEHGEPDWPKLAEEVDPILPKQPARLVKREIVTTYDDGLVSDAVHFYPRDGAEQPAADLWSVRDDKLVTDLLGKLVPVKGPLNTAMWEAPDGQGGQFADPRVALQCWLDRTLLTPQAAPAETHRCSMSCLNGCQPTAQPNETPCPHATGGEIIRETEQVTGRPGLMRCIDCGKVLKIPVPTEERPLTTYAQPHKAEVQRLKKDVEHWRDVARVSFGPITGAIKTMDELLAALALPPADTGLAWRTMDDLDYEKGEILGWHPKFGSRTLEWCDESGGFHDKAGDFAPLSWVTQWMPLPTPPAAKAG